MALQDYLERGGPAHIECMSYNARVVEVMIASPGDLGAERQVIRELVHEWNAIYARERRLVVLPVGWETHASPRLGDRPQEVINKQILEDVDLLVGVFWTRLGTPTGVAASGTVEEIEKHVAAGKPAMLYFSNAPVHPDSVDPAQYQALREFRDRYTKRGLVEMYASIAEFREKFARQFAQTLLRDFDDQGTGADVALTATAAPRLMMSPEAELMLRTAAQGGAGVILVGRYGYHIEFQANDTILADVQAGRELAKWEAALEQLLEHELVVDRSANREVFYLTDAGYRLADTLPDKREAAQ